MMKPFTSCGHRMAGHKQKLSATTIPLASHVHPSSPGQQYRLWCANICRKNIHHQRPVSGVDAWHCNMTGNELADKQTTQGSTTTVCTASQHCCAMQHHRQRTVIHPHTYSTQPSNILASKRSTCLGTVIKKAN